MYDDAYTRNDDGELAVRTVSVTEGSNSSSYDDVFTRDTDGKLALRVVGSGGGGGDQHNKGYFATQSALEEAYPTGEAGDYAIVGSTDTVWLWDEDTSAWIDSDQKGQVTSVNNQTGAVVLDAQDVGAVPQYSLMPTASEDELGNIYQFVGTTDANYTNGYFYKCVSDGQEPATYSWSQVSVQPTPDPLPSQTGNSGKFLTTDGTNASWSDKPLVNKATQSTSISLYRVESTNNTINIDRSPGSDPMSDCVTIGYNCQGGSGAVCIGRSASASSTGQDVVAIGKYAGNWGRNCNKSIFIGVSSGSSGNGSGMVVIGPHAKAKAANAIQLGGNGTTTGPENADANTFKVANANGNYEIMSADGTIPTDRFTTTPSADGTYYPTLSISSGTATRSWGTINALENKAIANNSMIIAPNGIVDSYDAGIVLYTGSGQVVTSAGSVAINSSRAGVDAICINAFSATGANAIQLGGGVSASNPDANTVKIGNANGNFEIMSADGTVPTARLTKVNTTITLASADWSSNTQTVNVTGMTATGVVFVNPDPTDQADYTSAGILCTAQGAGTLTFTCDTTPTSDIDVVVIML